MSSAENEKSLKTVGLVIWGVLVLFGLMLQVKGMIIAPLSSKNPVLIFEGEAIGAFFAVVPALTVYIWVPRLIDRFEPEPWWALGMALCWGALVAAGISGLVNSSMSSLGAGLGAVAGGRQGAALGSQIFGASISAPIVEEATKAAFVLWMFLFMRREFDGAVDGVIYAIFSAIGFAIAENIYYYSMALLARGDFGFQFALRGILKPWGHPFYTALTGLGIGIARETPKTWLKFAAPLGGYVLAVLFHMGWNTSSLVGALFGIPSMVTIIVMLVTYFLIMLCFLGLVLGLVWREGRKLRENLRDEVLIGNLTQGELDLVCSAFGRIKARMRKGGTGVEFLNVAAKLGMTKWHLARATEGKKVTISGEAIVPLRQQLLQLKQQMGSHLA